MKVKLKGSEYDNLRKMSKNNLEKWITSIYKSGYEEGFETCKHSAVDGEVDFMWLSILIQTTKGVGPILHKRIMDRIEEIAFNDSEVDK